VFSELERWPNHHSRGEQSYLFIYLFIEYAQSSKHKTQDKKAFTYETKNLKLAV